MPTCPDDADGILEALRHWATEEAKDVERAEALAREGAAPEALAGQGAAPAKAYGQKLRAWARKVGVTGWPIPRVDAAVRTAAQAVSDIQLARLNLALDLYRREYRAASRGAAPAAGRTTATMPAKGRSATTTSAKSKPSTLGRSTSRKDVEAACAVRLAPLGPILGSPPCGCTGASRPAAPPRRTTLRDGLGCCGAGGPV